LKQFFGKPPIPKNNKPEDDADWSLATWEGSRRETLRRWARLPLERAIAALEEMQELNGCSLSKQLQVKGHTTGRPAQPSRNNVVIIVPTPSLAERTKKG